MRREQNVGFSIKAVLVALAAMLAIDAVLGVALFAVYAPIDLNATEAQVIEATNQFSSNTTVLIWSMVLGTLSTVLAGYIAARIAKKAPYLNSGVIAILGVVMGLLVADDFPFWFNAVAFVVVPLAALFGGYLGKRPSVAA